MEKEIQARRLDGKVAVITGGASGIGAATVKLFILHGARVVIADIQDDLGVELANQLGKNACYVHCDVVDESQVAAAVDLAVSKYGSLDIVFNNAGILTSGRSKKISFAELDMKDVERVFQINITGVMHGVKHAARIMIPAKSGSIISTSSTSHLVAATSFHPYIISKHAVTGITKSAAGELCRHGIRVNCISPGAVSTALMRQFASVMTFDGELDGCDPGNIAHAALYLASDDGKLVNGHDLVVDEGISNVGAWNMFSDIEAGRIKLAD